MDSGLRKPHLSALLLTVVISATGCARLPAPLAPVDPAPRSAIELEEFLATGSPYLRYTQDARLRTPAGAVIRGRDAIQTYLGARTTAQPHDFRFRTEDVYRCGPESGVETGTYRALEQVGRRTRPIVGRWYAKWRRLGDHRWAIEDGRLLGPGEPLPPIDDECMNAEAQVRAESRFTATLQGAPFAFFSADPHHDLEFAGRLPYYSSSVASPALMVSATYRLGRWLVVGGYWGRDPQHRTSYWIAEDRQEQLFSRVSYTALGAGYEGRNVSFTVAPARVRSRWYWNSTLDALIEDHVDDRRWGAVVTARAVQSLQWDLGVELMLQYRWFGSDVVPRTDARYARSQNGLFIGLGLALRRTP